MRFQQAAHFGLERLRGERVLNEFRGDLAARDQVDHADKRGAEHMAENSSGDG